MARALKDILEGNEGYRANTKDEARFKAKHKTAKHKDRNGNDDKHFRASNIKPYKKSLEHGYDWPKDEKVYEETETVDEASTFQNWKSGDRAKLKKKLKEKGEKKRTDNAREYWGNLKGAQNADKESYYAKKYGGEKAAATQKELSNRMHKKADENIKQARVGGRWVERGENLRKTRNYMTGKGKKKS